jgi:hypothetical protein
MRGQKNKRGSQSLSITNTTKKTIKTQKFIAKQTWIFYVYP